MLESFTVQTFSCRLGEAFRVYPDASDPLERVVVQVARSLTSWPPPAAVFGWCC